ncbi:MAG: TonB-dependent hemoglobin/transferrin/lactoferrin family receptor [Colwellia sp.]
MKILNKSALALAISISFTPLMYVFADEYEAKVDDLEVIVVSGSRTEKPLKDIAGSISVITAAEIEKNSVSDMNQLFKYDPSVYVTGSTGGAQNIIVRGMGGDRVLMIKDGMRMNEGYGANGANDFVGRGYIETDTLKQVEVAKGAGSSLYGSDALGGIVVFTTKDASDVLTDGENFAGNVKLGYASDGYQANIGTTLALKTGAFEQFLNLNYRDGHEEENYAEDRNPFDITSESALYKAKYIIDDDNFISFIADFWQQETKGESADGLLSAFRTLADYGYIIAGENSSGDKETSSFKLDYQSTTKTALYDYLSVSIYNKKTSQEDVQYGLLDINSPAFNTFEKRHMWQTSTYEQDTFGFLSNATKKISNNHTLGFGLDIETTETLRTVYEYRTVEGEDEPTRDLTTDKFPVNEVDRIGIFVNDEISLLDGQLLLTPGARFDTYKMDPGGALKLDGTEFSSIEKDNVSFNLGALYKIRPDLITFVQFGQGFKVPAYDLAYIQHTQIGYGYYYEIIPSEDLAPEKSDTFEVGMRGHAGDFAFTAAVYYNKFDDFISIDTVSVDDVVGPYGPVQKLTWQYQNIDAVTIKGVELGINYFVNENITLFANAAIQEGKDDTTDEYIESINPLMGSAGISFEQENWSTELIVNWADRMTKVNEDKAEVAGYGSVDWLVNWQVTNNVKFNLAANNIFDKEHVMYSSVAGFKATDSLTKFTEAGINFSANIKYSF